MRNLVSSSEKRAEPTRVVVVGGGAAGVVTAAHLLRAATPDQPVDVRVIEKDATTGPGLAYRTSEPLHTLNNFAGRMSAIDDDPDHLLRWCAANDWPADPTSFLPRKLYGRYLSEVLDDAPVPPGSALHLTRGEVTDLRQDGSDVEVETACGLTVRADKVVLALGNPPPRRQPELEALGDRYHADPWAPDLSARVSSSREVLLLGTGLTTIDVVAMLREASPTTRFTAVSRRALLPAAHRRGSLPLHDGFEPHGSSLDELVDCVGDRIEVVETAGGDWRDVVESVRVCANDLWRGLAPEEQDRFVDSVARRWETARHRMSPDMAGYVDELRQSGTLHVARIEDVDVSRFDHVVNCTGPAPVPTRGWNRLVDSLLERGSIRPHRLGLGLDLDADGRIVDHAGRPSPHVYATGAARRGIEWEVAAIPDLRAQAARLAGHLLQGHTSAADPVSRTGVVVPA